MQEEIRLLFLAPKSNVNNEFGFYMLRCVVSILCLPLLLFGQPLEQSAPKKLRDKPYQGKIFPDFPDEDLSNDRRVIIQNTKGLVLYGDVINVRSEGVEGVEGLEIENLKIPGPVKELQEALNPIYLNQPLTYSKIYEFNHSGLESQRLRFGINA